MSAGADALPARARLLAAALALLGCELSDRAWDAGADAGVAARGSAACGRWQDQFCAYTARCGLLDRADCDAQNRGIVCRDDAEAERCAAEFATSSCGAPPFGCDVVDVADRRAAAVACENFFDAMCTSNTRCGLFDSVADCLRTPPFQFDCDRALAISLDYELCLDALEERLCHEAVPICNDVVRGQ